MESPFSSSTKTIPKKGEYVVGGVTPELVRRAMNSWFPIATSASNSASVASTKLALASYCFGKLLEVSDASGVGDTASDFGSPDLGVGLNLVPNFSSNMRLQFLMNSNLHSLGIHSNKLLARCMASGTCWLVLLYNMVGEISVDPKPSKKFARRLLGVLQR